MAKDEEEEQQQQEEYGEEHEGGEGQHEHEGAEEGEEYDQDEGQNKHGGGEEGEEQTRRYDDDGDEEMEDLTEINVAQSSRQRHLQSQYGGRGVYRR